jgi:ethanolamine permease
LAIAVLLMAVTYTCLVFGLAELARAMPVAGPDMDLPAALGTFGRLATGTAIQIEYAIAPTAIAVFIGGYVESPDLFGLTNGWPVYLTWYPAFVGLHLGGR